MLLYKILNILMLKDHLGKKQKRADKKLKSQYQAHWGRE